MSDFLQISIREKAMKSLWETGVCVITMYADGWHYPVGSQLIFGHHSKPSRIQVEVAGIQNSDDGATDFIVCVASGPDEGRRTF
jgi:hypothetical protein